MSLNKEDIDLIERHFDRQLDQDEKKTFDVKYLTSDSFKDEVDLRKNLIENVEALREDDLRKQFTAHMHVIDEKKKEKANIRKNFSVAASFLLILSSLGIYLTINQSKGPQQLFDEYYSAFDGVAHTRDDADLPSEGSMHYLQGNYEAALQSLIKLETHTTTDLMMISISYLETNQPKHAISWLSKIETEATHDMAAVKDWYLALSYLKNGQVHECKAILENKTLTNSIYSNRAAALLNEGLFHE